MWVLYFTAHGGPHTHTPGDEISQAKTAGSSPAATLSVENMLTNTLQVIINQGTPARGPARQKGLASPDSYRLPPCCADGNRCRSGRGGVRFRTKRKEHTHRTYARTHARSAQSQTRARHANTVSQTVNHPNRAGRPSSWPELPFFFAKGNKKEYQKTRGSHLGSEPLKGRRRLSKISQMFQSIHAW